MRLNRFLSLSVVKVEKGNWWLLGFFGFSRGEVPGKWLWSE
jgi:hypothetical protein